MNGIEFLEQAMDVFPCAKRVLLTAYADTDAAIDAINVVDLDHYLLKPWDPPEEKLYPVLTAARGVGAPRRHEPCRDQGRRPPLVRALVRGPRLPGPQPGAVPLVHLRRPGGGPAARRGRSARTTRRSRSSSPPTATCCVAPTDAELAARVGLLGRPGGRLLRRGRGRRRPRRAGRRGLRRLRGPAHAAGRAHRHRRPGRPERPDRELPRASPTGSPAPSWPSAPAGRR